MIFVLETGLRDLIFLSELVKLGNYKGYNIVFVVFKQDNPETVDCGDSMASLAGLVIEETMACPVQQDLRE